MEQEVNFRRKFLKLKAQSQARERELKKSIKNLRVHLERRCNKYIALKKYFLKQKELMKEINVKNEDVKKRVIEQQDLNEAQKKENMLLRNENQKLRKNLKEINHKIKKEKLLQKFSSLSKENEEGTSSMISSSLKSDDRVIHASENSFSESSEYLELLNPLQRGFQVTKPDERKPRLQEDSRNFNWTPEREKENKEKYSNVILDMKKDQKNPKFFDTIKLLEESESLAKSYRNLEKEMRTQFVKKVQK
eukprot:snap_masked-scaffold_19-processed-gene-1.17-mRNA-1 protein AED:1.00 eAED:1.00 QI:0/-1/0/0/-1/1/1/0/248